MTIESHFQTRYILGKLLIDSLMIQRFVDLTFRTSYTNNIFDLSFILLKTLIVAAKEWREFFKALGRIRPDRVLLNLSSDLHEQGLLLQGNDKNPLGTRCAQLGEHARFSIWVSLLKNRYPECSSQNTASFSSMFR